jgi:methyl-accepting chemotaxis protein
VATPKDFEAAHEKAQSLSTQEDKARAIRGEALQTLVDVFACHLDQMASGDLSTRITENLDENYEDLRDSFTESA